MLIIGSPGASHADGIRRDARRNCRKKYANRTSGKLSNGGTGLWNAIVTSANAIALFNYSRTQESQEKGEAFH